MHLSKTTISPLIILLVFDRIEIGLTESLDSKQKIGRQIDELP